MFLEGTSFVYGSLLSSNYNYTLKRYKFSFAMLESNRERDERIEINSVVNNENLSNLSCNLSLLYLLKSSFL